jgi:hypothetical protein
VRRAVEHRGALASAALAALGLATAALAALAGGCGSDAPSVAKPGQVPPFRIDIRAPRDLNQGGPLFVVVRKTDRAGFLAEDYDAIADGLFSEPRDPAVLRKAIVRPGQVMRMNVQRELADGEILGIYFLFSTPGDDWRLAIADPQAAGVRVVLGASGVESAEQQQ